MDNVSILERVNETTITWLIRTRGGARIKEVPGSFCEALLSQVRETIPAMVRGASYTLEEICGNDFWESLNRGQRILAGECMAHMVVHTNDLPELMLTKAPRTHPLEYGLR